jgi:hypothetical protein
VDCAPRQKENAMPNIQKLLSHLEKVKATGPNKWLARCPAHPDKHPSLSIKQTDAGAILIHCFAGCDVQSVVSCIGLTLSDLMPERSQGYDRTKNKAPKFNKFELFDRVVFEATLLSLAVSDLLNGKPIADEDLQRIEAAEELINELAREVRL